MLHISYRQIWIKMQSYYLKAQTTKSKMPMITIIHTKSLILICHNTNKDFFKSKVFGLRHLKSCLYQILKKNLSMRQKILTALFQLCSHLYSQRSVLLSGAQQTPSTEPHRPQITTSRSSLSCYPIIYNGSAII